MKGERKADVAASLAELELELALAIRQGQLKDGLNWVATIDTGDGDPYFAVLTVSPVAERKESVHG